MRQIWTVFQHVGPNHLGSRPTRQTWTVLQRAGPKLPRVVLQTVLPLLLSLSSRSAHLCLSLGLCVQTWTAFSVLDLITSDRGPCSKYRLSFSMLALNHLGLCCKQSCPSSLSLLPLLSLSLLSLPHLCLSLGWVCKQANMQQIWTVLQHVGPKSPRVVLQTVLSLLLSLSSRSASILPLSLPHICLSLGLCVHAWTVKHAANMDCTPARWP